MEKKIISFLDKIASLTPTARRIICEQATEYPHSGIYNTVMQHGTYLCRRCGIALFRASTQFAASCGWPSFDDSLAHHVKQLLDADGLRTEIRCHRCDGHLGHVFTGEYLTAKNHRYCVNSAAIDFVENNIVLDTEEAIVAGGCFWGVEYYLQRLTGVVKVESGYTGGSVLEPSYEQVCSGNTGHYEAVRVIYDSANITYSDIIRRFFEIHDPTQRMGQGPDAGHQYQSAIFYYNQKQYEEANALCQELIKNGFDVATKLLPVQIFWPAEQYHQNYYGKVHKTPYCHKPVERFKR